MLCPLLLLGACGTLGADPLTEADRNTLLEQLRQIEQTANERIDERFRRAIRDYSAAMRSDDDALDLYLNCVEKVDFEEQLRDNSEFRDWKRNQETKLGDPGFRLALRYQLRWLTLVLKSASKGADKSELAKEAFDQLGTIYRDIEAVENQQDLLKQAVTSSPFARAYGIHHTESGFPLSPTAVSQIYEDVILPPLRSGRMVEALKTTWQQRIRLEEIDATAWADRDTRVYSGGKRDRDREREARDHNRDEKRINEEKFITETRPELIWSMEVDLFNAGDQTRAAGRMLSHINSHITHKSCSQWLKQLEALLSPTPPQPEVEQKPAILNLPEVEIRKDP